MGQAPAQVSRVCEPQLRGCCRGRHAARAARSRCSTPNTVTPSPASRLKGGWRHRQNPHAGRQAFFPERDWEE